VLRSGAAVGDAICVTGCFGGAWLTERHLRFSPRIAEARRLASACELHAMIDVSDGLALDLWRLCGASGVGAEVVAGDVPVCPDAAAGRDVEPLKAALADGEDYELLFALAPADADRIIREQPLDVAVTRIGTVTAGAGLTLIRAGGVREALEPLGWEHET
jgi:thiamine-monophosphate kinase